MATADAIASAFLDELGAPDSPAMRKAVRAWLLAESGNNVIGGNPWNISYPAALEIARKGGPKPIGYRVHSKTGQKFALYSSSTVGARASARLLTGAGSDWRGYDKIVAAARRGSAADFLNALARSAWDAGRYGTKNGGSNKLITIFNRLAGPGGAIHETPGNPVTTPMGPQGPNGEDWTKVVGGWGGHVNFPEGHILTAADIDTIMAQLVKAGYFPSGGVGTVAYDVTKGVLTTQIGKPWNKATQLDIQARLGTAANEASDAGGLRAPLEAIAGFVGTLTDPGNWVRILALLVGGGMVAFGTVAIVRGGSTSVPNPLP